MRLRNFLTTPKQRVCALAVNCISTADQPALAAGREVGAPMMIQFSNGGAQFFISKGISKEKQPEQSGRTASRTYEVRRPRPRVPVV
jgi:fructose-bisphosphate aldolase class II